MTNRPHGWTDSELETAVQMMDAYRGPEAGRQRWLADQFTAWGQHVTEAEWDKLEADAAELIAYWRERADAALRNMPKVA